MNMWITYGIIAVILIIAELLYFCIADRCNIIDKPNERSSHSSIVLRGRVVEEFYDERDRTCVAAYEISPGGPICALNIPAGTWHTLRSLESGTVILEVKDGPYEPIGAEDVLVI